MDLPGIILNNDDYTVYSIEILKPIKIRQSMIHSSSSGEKLTLYFQDGKIVESPDHKKSFAELTFYKNMLQEAGTQSDTNKEYELLEGVLSVRAVGTNINEHTTSMGSDSVSGECLRSFSMVHSLREGIDCEDSRFNTKNGHLCALDINVKFNFPTRSSFEDKVNYLDSIAVLLETLGRDGFRAVKVNFPKGSSTCIDNEDTLSEAIRAIEKLDAPTSSGEAKKSDQDQKKVQGSSGQSSGETPSQSGSDNCAH